MKEIKIKLKGNTVGDLADAIADCILKNPLQADYIAEKVFKKIYGLETANLLFYSDGTEHKLVQFAPGVKENRERAEKELEKIKEIIEI